MKGTVDEKSRVRCACLLACGTVFLSATLVFGEVGFRIEVPKENAVLQSGQQVTTAVELGTEIAVGRVRYYWYRVGEEPVVSQQASPALVSTDRLTPPYGGKLTVPTDAIGAMRLLAVGEVVSGRLAGREEFDEIIVYAEPAAALSRIEFESEKPLKLSTLWKTLDLPVVGLFGDGVIRPIAGKGTGSTFKSSNEQVVTISAEGCLRVVGNGTATVIVNNRGQQGTLEIIVKTDGEENRPPIADAGPDQTVKGESIVVLNGLRSTDPDGDPLQYEWKQLRGNKIPLLDTDSPKATFAAPRVSARRLFRFRLQVTDLKGPDTLKGADSLPSFTNVWVEP
jgi:hypothetical protein